MNEDLALDRLEVASGLLLGRMSDRDALPDHGGVTTRAGFESAVLQALKRAPCGVSFSGGRDSSSVLAVATRVARREGLPDPIPITLRFPHVASSDEDAWQQRVVDHLGLKHWERVVLGDEADAIGPYAQRVLLKHGVLWPANTHFHVPIFDRVVGGSLLTGVGGDEVLIPYDWLRVNRVLSGDARPRPKDILRIGLAYGPVSLRRRWLLREAEGVRLSWLHPHAQKQVMHRFSHNFADDPIGWDAWIQQSWWRDRARLVGNFSLQKIADDADVVVTHPMQDAAFLHGLAREQGRTGFRSRTMAMESLFGGDLPPELLSRSTKAYFDDVFLADQTRGFMRGWDGDGVDEDLIDPEALKGMWRSAAGDVDGRSVLLMQSIWLQRQLGSGQER